MSALFGRLLSFLHSSTTSAPLTMAVKDSVENAIAGNKITIFSKSYCPYCERAKSILLKDFANIKEQIYITELDEVDDGSAIQQYLAEKTGQRTVPNIFINQKHIGGCDNIVRLQTEGKLPGLVAGDA